MASVGGITCDYVHGSAAGKKETTHLWRVPGLDGYGAHLLGLGDSETVFRAVRFNTAAAVHVWVGLLESLQGQVIVVVNDWAETVSGFFVTRVGRPQITADLGNGGARGEIEIEGVIT